MLDHAVKWDTAPDWTAAKLIGKHVTVHSIELPDQALVSGDLAAFGRIAAMDERGVGAFGLVTDANYTVRLARDRLLVVGPLPAPIRDGWNEAGFAVTSVGGADHIFELGGDGVNELLSRATTVNPDNSGQSASVGFASVSAIIYRHGPASVLRLHVERGLAVYMWTWLKTVLGEERNH